MARGEPGRGGEGRRDGAQAKLPFLSDLPRLLPGAEGPEPTLTGRQSSRSVGSRVCKTSYRGWPRSGCEQHNVLADKCSEDRIARCHQMALVLGLCVSFTGAGGPRNEKSPKITTIPLPGLTPKNREKSQKSYTKWYFG